MRVEKVVIYRNVYRQKKTGFSVIAPGLFFSLDDALEVKDRAAIKDQYLFTIEEEITKIIK